MCKQKLVGSRLRALRKGQQLTIYDLSDMTGIHVRTISAYETERRSPHEKNLLRLCKFFGVTSGYLTGEQKYFWKD